MLKKLTTISFLAIFIALPALAAGGLIPCDGVCSPNSTNCISCTPCHFLQMVVNIANFIVKNVVPPLAGLLFLIGGIMMIMAAGSESRFKKGKEIIVNTGIGVVIVLGSWLIINTLILAIARQDAGYNPQGWSEINCSR